MEFAAHASGAPEWTGAYVDNPVPRIQQYVSERLENKNTFRHIHHFIPFIEQHWDEVPDHAVFVKNSKRRDDQQCREMISNIPWLEAFTGVESRLRSATNALATSPNHCTRLLARFLVLLANHIIMAEWKIQVLEIIRKGVTRVSFPLLREKNAQFVSAYIGRLCEDQNLAVESLWRSLQEAVTACPLDEEYQATAQSVANFCFLAGCPSTVPDSLKNVELLREHLSSRPSEIREAELRREIEDLRRENHSQQRIITNLTFRHLLENLPPVPSKPMSSTARWTDFFKNALKKAQKQSKTNAQPHPLHPVLRKYTNTNQVETVGTGLYSTFSTNIHHFSSQYAVMESQWNAMESDIMKALVPISSNIIANDVDWQTERQRY